MASIQGLGSGGEFARAAIEAALKSQSQLARRIDDAVASSFAGVERAQAEKASNPIANAALDKLAQVDRSVSAVDQLPVEMATGGISDFHEVIGQLKQSELTFKFALEVRNKLIDAYRETMRMSV